MKDKPKNKYRLVRVKFGYQLEINGELTATWFGQYLPQDVLDEYGAILDETQHLLKRVQINNLHN